MGGGEAGDRALRPTSDPVSLDLVGDSDSRTEFAQWPSCYAGMPVNAKEGWWLVAAGALRRQSTPECFPCPTFFSKRSDSPAALRLQQRQGHNIASLAPDAHTPKTVREGLSASQASQRACMNPSTTEAAVILVIAAFLLWRLYVVIESTRVSADSPDGPQQFESPVEMIGFSTPGLVLVMLWSLVWGAINGLSLCLVLIELRDWSPAVERLLDSWTAVEAIVKQYSFLWRWDMMQNQPPEVVALADKPYVTFGIGYALERMWQYPSYVDNRRPWVSWGLVWVRFLAAPFMWPLLSIVDVAREIRVLRGTSLRSDPIKAARALISVVGTTLPYVVVATLVFVTLS